MSGAAAFSAVTPPVVVVFEIVDGRIAPATAGGAVAATGSPLEGWRRCDLERRLRVTVVCCSEVGGTGMVPSGAIAWVGGTTGRGKRVMAVTLFAVSVFVLVLAAEGVGQSSASGDAKERADGRFRATSVVVFLTIFEASGRVRGCRA